MARFRGFKALSCLLLALLYSAGAVGGCLEEIEKRVRALPESGVSQEITDTLLQELRQTPERWLEIGNNLVDATLLTHLIERTAVRQHPEMVPLKLLSTTHTLSDAQDLQKLESRTSSLKAHSTEILAIGEVSQEMRHRIIPSESPVIRAARTPEGHYYVFDGNGRTEALRAARAYE